MTPRIVFNNIHYSGKFQAIPVENFHSHQTIDLPVPKKDKIIGLAVSGFEDHGSCIHCAVGFTNSYQ
jgi:hypothetical protein